MKGMALSKPGSAPFFMKEGTFFPQQTHFTAKFRVGRSFASFQQWFVYFPPGLELIFSMLCSALLESVEMVNSAV